MHACLSGDTDAVIAPTVIQTGQWKCFSALSHYPCLPCIVIPDLCTVYSVTAVTDVHSEPDIRKGRRIDSPLIVSIFVLYREHVPFTTWN